MSSPMAMPSAAARPPATKAATSAERERSAGPGAGRKGAGGEDRMGGGPAMGAIEAEPCDGCTTGPEARSRTGGAAAYSAVWPTAPRTSSSTASRLSVPPRPTTASSASSCAGRVQGSARSSRKASWTSSSAWSATTGSARPEKGSDRPSPWSQVTLMNARYTELIAGDPGPDSWAQAGDQLYLDLDISVANLPPGSRLELGEAVLEMSAEPHTGCAAFSDRFGTEALRLASSPEGRSLRLRGANAAVVRSGVVRTGDMVRKVG